MAKLQEVGVGFHPALLCDLKRVPAPVWALSSLMDAGGCISVLEDALGFS